MSSALAPDNAAVGLDPLAHMSFLIHAPERVLALRLALSRVIAPTSVVLDAGCGSLGLLSIMAAKLRASRVVAVDLGALGLAKALAEENGVAGRVHFVQGDLHDVPLSVEAFDVIVGMVYNNEIKTDLAQQRLIARLVERFGHADTAIIPNRVRYSVAGYDPTSVDRSGSTRRVEWDTHIVGAERLAGMTFAAVRRVLDQAGAPHLTWVNGTFSRIWARWRPSRLGRPLLRRNSLRYFDRTRMTLLTRPPLFAEIDYTKRSAWIEYPPTASLPVIRSGQLMVVIWQQDLLFDDLLIRTTESLNAVDTPQSVEPGDTAILSTGKEWQRFVPLVVKRGQGSEATS